MAETVIDQLIVKLSLDTVEFEQGEKKVAASLNETKKGTEKVGKNIAADGKKGAEFFVQLEKAALKFFAILTVGRGMADFSRAVIGTGAQLNRMAGVFGTTADSLSRWQGAVRQSGGTAEAFIGTMQGLSSSLTELRLTGTTGILPYLQALGVSIADSNGKAKPLEDILGDIGDKLNKLPNKGDAFNIGKSLGLDEGTINLLLKGRTEVERLLASQKAYSDSDARAARIAQERWEKAQIQIERTTQLLVIKAIPAFERLTKAMVDLSETSVPVLSTLYDWLEKIDAITGKWSSKIESLLPKFSNPTLQAMFGGTSKLLGSNPATGVLAGAAAAGETIREQIPLRERNAIDQARDQVLAFFGNKNAKKRLAQQPYGGEQSVSTGIIDRSGISRAERNNNPGNLEFRGQSGATPEDGEGRFAKFATPAEGVEALANQLRLDGSRGLNTIEKIIRKYAPSNENNTESYIKTLSKYTSIGRNENVDTNDVYTLHGLIKGISRIESGGDFLNEKDVLTGLDRSDSSSSKKGMPNLSIGEVKVYTQAQDANGIARDMRGAIIRQADTGVR